MKTMLSVLALASGAMAFQSCENYPNGASRGYYHGGYYGNGDHYGGGYYAGGGYYDGGGYYGGDYYDGGYGSTVVVSSGDREHHHDGYSNGYYERDNDHVNRNVQANRNVQLPVMEPRRSAAKEKIMIT
jgi:hypothetical protein